VHTESSFVFSCAELAPNAANFLDEAVEEKAEGTSAAGLAGVTRDVVIAAAAVVVALAVAPKAANLRGGVVG